MGDGGQVVEFEDLSSRHVESDDENAWLSRLSERIDGDEHRLTLRGVARSDDEDPPALSRDGDGLWWAGRFIGELRFEGRTLRISPRLGIEVVGEWLAAALNVDFVPQTASLGANAPLIAQLLDRVWSGALAEASRHGGPRVRRIDRREGYFIQGTLDVKQTIRLRGSGQQRVASRRFLRDFRNPVAEVIVLADRTLRSLLGVTPAWRPERVDEVLAHLRSAVGERPRLPNRKELAAVRYSPITRRFRSVAELSLEIAERSGRITSASDEQVSGFLIDVAELWELFLLHCTRLAFPDLHVEHGTDEGDRHLLEAMSNPGVSMGRMKPDIVVLDQLGRPGLVIDAKYKRLQSSRWRPSGVDRGDLYQLTSYMAGEPSATEGFLGYPPFPDDEAWAEKHGPWCLPDRRVITFERIPATKAEAVAALQAGRLVKPKSSTSSAGIGS
jgi:5-methylcytosine-specific restriction enzyme subunit McrC